MDESYKGLPRRVRQANLVPQLRDAPAAPGSPAAASGDNVVNRSPDDIRNALSAMQRGWQQGREDRDAAGNGFEATPVPAAWHPATCRPTEKRRTPGTATKAAAGATMTADRTSGGNG